jgi:hypothetical protein
MRPGPRGNPEHSARADHAPTWAHAVYELHAPRKLLLNALGSREIAGN